jgi:DNA invertase Pin-like site-specific DNA recombinase
MKAYVYIRVSSRDQNPAMQEDAINEYVAFKKIEVARIFKEKKSAKNTDRPAFKEMMTALESNPEGIDTVVIWRLDRIGRSLLDLLNIVGFLDRNGINLHSITNYIDTSTKEGRLFFHMSGAYAEYERESILERTMTGMHYAKLRGVKFGRKKKTPPMAEVERLIAIGVPKTKIAKQYGVSKTTLYTKIEEYRKQQIADATANPTGV